ncbi:MAG: hypothetical protein HW388_1244 [Dehalococcoidia bacterium]|nr:hypothetical protein [Dehalococcoidia bacterium]
MILQPVYRFNGGTVRTDGHRKAQGSSIAVFFNNNPGASEGIRTLDPRFTKPLLYH